MENGNLQNKIPKPSMAKNAIIFILMIIFICGAFYFMFGTPRNEIGSVQFLEGLESNIIESVNITSSAIEITYTKDSQKKPAYIGYELKDFVIEEITKYNAVDANNDINITSNIESEFSWVYLLYPILIFGAGYLIISFFAKQLGKANKQSMDFTKSRAKIALSRVTFASVAGAEEEKEEVKEIVEFLKNPQKFTDMGARIPKGVLLVGPPGTGKTLLAKAIAGEANVPFFTISGSDFMELFVGVGASRVRDLFNDAKKASPCIVFIDEIDAIGRQRGTGLGGGNDEREQTLNQLLVQMDGFETNEGVIVIAATNRADILDPALMRPGRFDRQIYMHLPDVKGREEILKVHSNRKKFANDVDFKQIARVTSGFTGAEIENLLNEAAILAARDNKTEIDIIDITEAIDKVTMGPQKTSRVITERDKKITAYHEAGHAVVAKLVKNSDPIHEVSIIPRGAAAGYTVSRPETDDNHITKSKLYDTITMMLAGRKAEEIFIGDYTTGASNDIQRATSIARKMVVEFGMGENTGLMYLGSENSYFFGKDYVERNTYSDQYANMIDDEVKKILNECSAAAEKIITANKKKLNTMVEVLLAKNTIYTNEVDMIMEGKSASDVIAVIENKPKRAEKKQQEKVVENSTNLKTNIIKVKKEKNNDDDKPADDIKVDMLKSKDISTEFADVLKDGNKGKKK